MGKELFDFRGLDILQGLFGNGASFSFSLPLQKPDVAINDISCSSSLALTELVETTDQASDLPLQNLVTSAQSDSSTTQSTPPPAAKDGKALPKRKRGKKVPISKMDLRRSDRIHNQHKGFKPSVCKDRNCLGCSPNPPLLSSSVVRDLGKTFCSIDASQLSDDILNAKAQKGAVGRSTSKKPKLSKELMVGPPNKLQPKEKEAKKNSKAASDQDPEAGSSRGAKD